MGFENGKLLRVVVRATNGSRQEVNTFHYDLQDDVSQPANDPQQLADDFRDDVIPAFQPFYSSAWEFDPVYVVEEKDPQNPLAPRSSWNSGSSVPGTGVSSSDHLPSACCVVVKLTTDKIGRRFNGRLFIGGTRVETEQNAGTWQSTLLTAVDNLIAAIPVQPDLAGGASTSTANWCVYSRTQRAANLDPYASHITGHVTRSAVHWLRRRAGVA